MRSIAISIFLSIALSAAAQEPARDQFPDDYKPQPCAPANSCRSFQMSELKGAAYRFLGLQLDGNWIDAHGEEVLKLFGPECRKHATCVATPGNSYLFCDDVLAPRLRDVCSKNFPKATNARDWDQCQTFMEIYTLGVDMHAKAVWDEAQACLKGQAAPVHPKPLDVWLEPNPIPRGWKKDVTFFALDPDSHIPVLAEVRIEGQIVYAPANPTGTMATYYGFKLPIKYKRVPNAEGHTDVAPRMVTVTAPGYPLTTLELPAPPPKVIVEMLPPPDKLKSGPNTVTVTARDAETGKPVELRVMVGTKVAGESNKPFVLELKGKKRPEIWTTSLFDTYSDAVVMKATK